MSAKAGWSTPMLHVAEVERSHEAWLERLEKKRAAGIIP